MGDGSSFALLWASDVVEVCGAAMVMAGVTITGRCEIMLTPLATASFYQGFVMDERILMRHMH
jgi:hypothetical protein